MENYDSYFLPSYFQNVCGLQLLNRRLSQKTDALEAEVHRLSEEGISPIPRDQRESIIPWVAACAVFLLWAWLEPIHTLCWIASASFTACVAIITVPENSRKEIERQRELAACWTLEKQRKEANKGHIAQLESEIEHYRGEQKKLQAVLSRVYNAGILPSKYRNCYAAAFLHRWVGDSVLPELSAAIQALARYDFSMQQIRQQVETYIDKNSSQILSHCIFQAAEQEKRDASLRAKLDELEIPDEKKNVYLHILDANAEAINYFASVNYLDPV